MFPAHVTSANDASTPARESGLAYARAWNRIARVLAETGVPLCLDRAYADLPTPSLIISPSRRTLSSYGSDAGLSRHPSNAAKGTSRSAGQEYRRL